ncbi:MAG: hypothetical protein AAFQ82_09525, partial [Myxococcota bacterium]
PDHRQLSEPLAAPCRWSSLDDANKHATEHLVALLKDAGWNADVRLKKFTTTSQSYRVNRDGRGVRGPITKNTNYRAEISLTPSTKGEGSPDSNPFPTPKMHADSLARLAAEKAEERANAVNNALQGVTDRLHEGAPRPFGRIEARESIGAGYREENRALAEELEGLYRRSGWSTARVAVKHGQLNVTLREPSVTSSVTQSAEGAQAALAPESSLFSRLMTGVVHRLCTRSATHENRSEAPPAKMLGHTVPSPETFLERRRDFVSAAKTALIDEVHAKLEEAKTDHEGRRTVRVQLEGISGIPVSMLREWLTELGDAYRKQDVPHVNFDVHGAQRPIVVFQVGK